MQSNLSFFLSKVLEAEDITSSIVYALSTPPRVQVHILQCNKLQTLKNSMCDVKMPRSFKSQRLSTICMHDLIVGFSRCTRQNLQSLPTYLVWAAEASDSQR